MKTVIICAMHKPAVIQHVDVLLPVMAGSVLCRDQILGEYDRDDSGDNISEKNREYCELTALYWAWKNLDADILGLCHYRRYFASASLRGQLLTANEAEHLLNYYDVLLPKARNYVFETNYSQYANAHHETDLVITRQIIQELYPEYLEAFDSRMLKSVGHRFNMFVMKRSVAERYCGWLFDILAELEKRLDISGYNEKDRRVFGFVAERLLDVWIDANGLRTTDVGYVFTGREHLLRKAAAMCIRKAKAAVNNMTGR